MLRFPTTLSYGTRSEDIRVHLTILVIVASFLITGLFGSDDSKAGTTSEPDLQCAQAIPCPKGIRPRVNFWIDVYSRWNSTDAILHDKSSPERIYRVLTGQSCGGQHGSPIIERQKDEIKEELRHLANRLDGATGIFAPRDRELLALFPEGSGSMVRKAADGIRSVSYTHLTLPTTPYV